MQHAPFIPFPGKRKVNMLAVFWGWYLHKAPNFREQRNLLKKSLVDCISAPATKKKGSSRMRNKNLVDLEDLGDILGGFSDKTRPFLIFVCGVTNNITS